MHNQVALPRFGGKGEGDGSTSTSMKYRSEHREVLNWILAMMVFAAPSIGRAFFNPEQGRWLSRDPIGERGGGNLHRFAEGDAVNKIDKFGLIPDGPILIPPPNWPAIKGLCCLAHLWAQYGNIHNRAAKEARNDPTVGGIGPNGGPEDALRHCLGGCYLAQEIVKTPTCAGISVNDIIDEEEEGSTRVTKVDADNGKIGASAPKGVTCLTFCLQALGDGTLNTEDPRPT